MYLHLGGEHVVHTETIIGIFDMDSTTVQKASRQFLTRAEKEKHTINVSYELPKSFILCAEQKKEIVYIAQLAPSTLLKRSKTAFYHTLKK